MEMLVVSMGLHQFADGLLGGRASRGSKIHACRLPGRRAAMKRVHCLTMFNKWLPCIALEMLERTCLT